VAVIVIHLNFEEQSTGRAICLSRADSLLAWFLMNQTYDHPASKFSKYRTLFSVKVNRDSSVQLTG
jgi:hypothetical protein